MTDEKVTPKRGLEGVVVDSSAISKTIPEKSRLTYRGYAVDELARNCSFEEVAYLLWHGELPTKAELDTFAKAERAERELSTELLSVIKHFPLDAHPMDAVRTGVSFLGMEELHAWPCTNESTYQDSVCLLAKIPTIVAAFARSRRGEQPIPPRSDLSFSENFFAMCFGEVPDTKIVRAFDASLILYAEHGFNASTFTTRVVTSTMSDVFSAVTAGIGSLKGPLHGGANEAVMHMLKEIDDPAKARDWLITQLKEKRKVMGFGHRVYTHGDSRVPLMKEYEAHLAEITDNSKWLEISNILEETMISEKNIHPNLDFPAGPTYYMMGFEIELFTPIFVIARLSGWAAHAMEQAKNNRLIRPLSNYTGEAEREFIGLSAR